MQVSVDQVNYLNIGLMIVSCVAAFLFPFELFLISYAVLGPLHYLTEISWLHDRNYFTEAKPGKRKQRPHRGWLTLVAITTLILIIGAVSAEVMGLFYSPKWEITLFYLVFISALLITEVQKKRQKIWVFFLATALFVPLATSRYYIILAFFLVTIIHVFFFTGAFIFYGALKGRSTSGILSLAVFLLCAVSFFVYAPAGQAAGSYIRGSYRSFNALNAELMKLFSLGQGTSTEEVYQSQNGVMIMRLIAFSYTYHYLNWFSKTSIIRWHEVSRNRIAVIAAVWLASLVLYGYNYDTGMAVLYFISVLHVMLEFPLNHRTFAGIGRELHVIAK
jgi:hypothetical protein